MSTAWQLQLPPVPRHARFTGVPVRIRALGLRPVSTIMRPGESLVLGAAPDSDLVVVDPDVSERHCRLRHTGMALELEDLNSAGGVRIAGARIRWAELPLPAAFEIGTTTICAAMAQTEDRVLPGMVGRCPAMVTLGELIARVARTALPTLLRGETGTGKELAARAIHDGSRRAHGPFVAVNGATVVNGLGLSLLFGHVTGAFTGARDDRPGAFREADGGSLFIDEVAALPPEAQASLLRAIEEGVVVPIGADRGTAVDVRIIAATCEPLESLCAQGAFRLDLYQRLSVCVVEIPPLRNRRSDIPMLAEHLLATSELAGCRIDASALGLLQNDPLPGNVRELRNVLLEAALRSRGRVIRATDIALCLAARRPVAKVLDLRTARELIELEGGNVSAAARRTGLPRSTFRDLLQRGESS